MKKLLFSFLLGSTLLNCQSDKITTFSEAALNDEFITLDENVVPFSAILEQHKGQTIFIDVWASWCKDCRKSLPKVKELQKEFPGMSFVFLSLDKSLGAWKKGIQTYNLQGEHYFMQSGWKGAMGTFLDLDWIPRYLIVNQEGKIVVYKAIKTKDKNLRKHLK
ncbi:thioredoxin family protein [Flavobacteriaceae bacterium]|jgi:thiol-disulfide isomerase/thioredoxin|nr:thioredoxin family protein [Flavobacteriaceae bacterium]